MKFTPGQMREMLGVPLETFRHWKKVLPPLGERNGYSPCFTLGDLVALAAVKSLTDRAGVRVGSLAQLASPLFSVCNATSWVAIERGVIAVDPANGTATVSSSLADVPLNATVVVVSGKQLVSQLRDVLLAEHVANAQGAIPFPLQTVTKRRPTQSATIKRVSRRHSTPGAGR